MKILLKKNPSVLQTGQNYFEFVFMYSCIHYYMLSLPLISAGWWPVPADSHFCN